MNLNSRISSIQKTHCLDESVTGFKTFDLSQLKLNQDLDIELPSNLRLGHLAEKAVSALIKASLNYKLLQENIQLIEDKRTIGELDFILENKETEQLIHMELAYKFYLYDPKHSADEIKNWIGPNRKDSLVEKLDKLKSKQFPLLQTELAQVNLKSINTEEVSQALCFLVSLFVPFEFKEKLNPQFEQAVKGYYLNLETFLASDESSKSYYTPAKKEWGIEPSENENWSDLHGIQKELNKSIKEQQSRLVWQKQNDTYLSFFVCWW